MKRFVGQLHTEFLFLLPQAVLYISFLILDLTGRSSSLSSYIKFSMIVLCFCYVLFYCIANYFLCDKESSAGKPMVRFWRTHSCTDRSIVYVIVAALFFTLVSDLFLLLTDLYFYGVLTFILAQQLHHMRLILYRTKEEGQAGKGLLTRVYLIRVAIQAITAAIVLFVLVQVGVSLDGLLIAGVFYFICIVYNTILAIRTALRYRKDKGMVFMAIGMVLFLLCDINVGLFNIAGYVSLPVDIYEFVYTASSLLMWIFYAPSQVLIALSVRTAFLLKN